MSHGNLAVRFGDGTILYGEYSGTADVATPALYRQPLMTRGNVWHWMDPVHFEGEDLEDVEVATDYGGGMHWKGEATMRYTQLVTGLEPYGAEDSTGNVVEASREPEHGLPEWWPTQAIHDAWVKWKEARER